MTVARLIDELKENYDNWGKEKIRIYEILYPGLLPLHRPHPLLALLNY
jgi:hypothetical protein